MELENIVNSSSCGPFDSAELDLAFFLSYLYPVSNAVLIALP